MTLNIEDHVRWVIYNYPSLYRVRNNPELSRLHVLGSLFFTIGTGYEWDKDKGILTNGEIEPMVKLPEGFFEKELYAFDVENSKAEGFVDFLKDRFHYIKQDRYDNITTVIFEATEDEAKGWKWDWDNHRFRGRPKTRPTTEIELDSVYVNEQACDYDLHPYPLCNYSAIVELTKGKTDSPHIEDYSFADFPPQPDWIRACVDVAKEALAFYNDESRYCTDSYHPSNNIGRYQYEYKKAKKKGEEAEYRNKLGYEEGETPEERSHRSFEAHRKHQITCLEKFLNSN